MVSEVYVTSVKQNLISSILDLYFFRVQEKGRSERYGEGMLVTSLEKRERWPWPSNILLVNHYCKANEI